MVLKQPCLQVCLIMLGKETVKMFSDQKQKTINYETSSQSLLSKQPPAKSIGECF